MISIHSVIIQNTCAFVVNIGVKYLLMGIKEKVYNRVLIFLEVILSDMYRRGALSPVQVINKHLSY